MKYLYAQIYWEYPHSFLKTVFPGMLPELKAISTMYQE